MRKIEINQENVEKFNQKCEKSHLFQFNQFLNFKNANEKSILELLEQVKQTLNFAPCKKDKKIKFNEYVIADYMNDFFSKYMPQKAPEVQQILDKTHPYFIDSDGNAHINFTLAGYNDTRASRVWHSGRRSFLQFDVYYHDSVDDLRTTAHELSHAISSRNLRLIENIRAGKPTEENFDKDSICEIESLITERLFNRFLASKGLYTAKDLSNYNNAQRNSLLNEINLICEEQSIISNLTYPITYESVNNLVRDLQESGQNNLLKRLEVMAQENKDSPYMFRYVVGRIVADQWIERFENAPDARHEMLENFQNYLNNTHEMTLDKACVTLLGQNFAQLAENYTKIKTNENQSTKTQFF